MPFNIRVALKDTSLPRGGGPDGMSRVGIPEGTMIGYSPSLLHRRADLFGPDVNEFKPERWETWTPKPWQYIPFNGGPRICLGQQFALTEMGYVLVRYGRLVDEIGANADLAGCFRHSTGSRAGAARGSLSGARLPSALGRRCLLGFGRRVNELLGT